MSMYCPPPPDDEEEDERPGRPNAWWAEHKNDVADATDRAATFDSAVRGVSQGPHGGQQNVTSADVIGDLTYCWCGLPFDHDWPGKAQGRKHPREMSNVAQTSSEKQRIERRQLRAYNDDLVDVITEAVNGYGARYRMQKNGIVLFPPDGTTGITLSARTSARQVKSARLWFLRHCVGVGDDGQPTNPLVADTEVLTEDHARRVERNEAEARESAREDLQTIKASGPPRPESSVTEPVAETTAPEEPWVPYVGSDGEPNEFFETNGTLIRCKVCNGTPDAYETDNPRGIGGHIRIKHRDNSTMYSPEAREKALESRRLNRMTGRVEEAITLLATAIGQTPDTRRIKELEEQVATLTKRAEDAETRLALMREALQV